MNSKDFKLLVEENLLEIRRAHRVSKNQIALRCAFCGDSKKDINKTRFYVYINHDDDSPILYNCFNCGESGILTPSVLRTFNINNLDINTNLLRFNKSSIKKINKYNKFKDNKFNLSTPVPKNIKSNIIKKIYIETRIGKKFTIEELINLKVIFSLKQFLEYNKIDNVTCKPDRALRLNDDYVGFMSIRNEYIIYRDVTNKHKMRYDKYAIIPNIENSRKFYSIPNKIDVLSPDNISINIAEGVFDILGVFYHIRNQNLSNEIYVASCDSGFNSVIKYFLNQGLIGSNIIINIYWDSDHEPYFYKNLYKDVIPWVKEINLYYNSIGKDFGVPSSKIKLIRKKIV